VISVDGVFQSPVDKPLIITPTVDPITRTIKLTLAVDLEGITTYSPSQIDSLQAQVYVDQSQYNTITQSQEKGGSTFDYETPFSLERASGGTFTVFSGGAEEASERAMFTPLSLSIYDLTFLPDFSFKPLVNDSNKQQEIGTITMAPVDTDSVITLFYSAKSILINNVNVPDQTPTSLLVGIDPGILTGTSGDDLIWGSAGDDTLTGNGGNDTFLYNSSNKSNDLIKDFTVSASGDEKGSLDLSDLLVGFDAASSTLSEFLEVTNNGSDTSVKIDQNGDGSGFSDMTLTLEGVITDLDELKNNEQLIL
jgi:hypothetical protein